MKMFSYSRGPIDFFTGCLPVIDYLVRLREDGDGMAGIFELDEFLTDLRMFMDRVPLNDARHKGIDCILVFPVLPTSSDGNTMEYGFIFKEDNNGTTHIAIPFLNSGFIEDQLSKEDFGNLENRC